MTIATQARWTFSVAGPRNADELAECAQGIMEALLDRERRDEDLLDSGVAMDAGENTIAVEVTVRAASGPQLVERVTGVVRAAVHAAGHEIRGGIPPVGADRHDVGRGRG